MPLGGCWSRFAICPACSRAFLTVKRKPFAPKRSSAFLF
nr:MAG TPA: C2H2 type zinc-finger protein [Caudoviricetes sp.]